MDNLVINGASDNRPLAQFVAALNWPLAERLQILGGVALALSHDVAKQSRIGRAPRGRESVTDQLSRLVDAHEMLLTEARPLAREPSERGNDGSNDLIIGELVRANETQSWFVSEHLTVQAAPCRMTAWSAPSSTPSWRATRRPWCMPHVPPSVEAKSLPEPHPSPSAVPTPRAAALVTKAPGRARRRKT
jgi:hypothetical protein